MIVSYEDQFGRGEGKNDFGFEFDDGFGMFLILNF